MLLTGIVEVDDAIGRGAGAHGDSMESVAQPYGIQYVWLHARLRSSSLVVWNRCDTFRSVFVFDVQNVTLIPCEKKLPTRTAIQPW